MQHYAIDDLKNIYQIAVILYSLAVQVFLPKAISPISGAKTAFTVQSVNMATPLKKY